MSFYLQWLFKLIFIEFWRGVAAHVGAEAVEGAVVDLLHQPEHLQGDLAAPNIYMYISESRMTKL